MKEEESPALAPDSLPSPTPAPAKHQKSSIKPQKLNKAQLWQKIWLTVFYLAWALIGTYAGQLIVAFPMAWLLGEKLTDPGWTLVYYIITYTLTIALVVILPMQAVKYYRKRKNDKSKKLAELEKDLSSDKTDLGIAHLPTFVDIGLAPIAYIAYLMIASVLTRIMEFFPWFDAQESQDVGFSYFITSLDRVFAMIAIVLIAPIAEELVMRGWLYGKLRNKWNIVISILLTSLLFGVLHGQWNVAVSVFALSLMLCGLREITGTIWSGMLLHILSNGVAFYLLYIAL